MRFRQKLEEMTSSGSHSQGSLPPSPSRIRTPSDGSLCTEDGSALFQLSSSPEHNDVMEKEVNQHVDVEKEINQDIDVEKEVTRFVKELDANEGREECVFRTNVPKCAQPVADGANHYPKNLSPAPETSRDWDSEATTPTKETANQNKHGIPESTMLAASFERKLESRYPSFLGSRSSVSMRGAGTAGSVRSPSRRGAAADLVHTVLSPRAMEVIRALDEQKKQAESEGNYMEARVAAQRLNGVKVLEQNKRKTTMLDRHAREREEAKRACKQETAERNRLWDDKLHEFHKDVVEHAAKLKRQQIGVLQAFRQRMAAKSPTKPQLSRELLKHRTVQAFLGKQGKYLEADEVNRIADRMEHVELQATLAAYAAEVAIKEAALRAKQQNEMEVLLQRAAQGRDELRKTRTLDLERCALRHKNIVKELRTLQLQEHVKCEQILGKHVTEFKTSGGSLQMLLDTLRGMGAMALPGIPTFSDAHEGSPSHGSDSQ